MGWDVRYNNITYMKVRRFNIPGEQRKRQEKNWTPFVDPKERTTNDENIYLIYEWNSLQVLKCQLSNLTSDWNSTCQRTFNEPSQTKLGPLRRGTELIPINSNDKQIWFAFIRSHISKCGCGSSMYRPHLVILKSDESNFKVTHMTSSISFNVQAKSVGTTVNQCPERYPNVLMANGISNWEVNNTGSFNFDI